MSHTVNVTTAQSGPRILFNMDYFRATPGQLKLAELLLGVVCVSVIGHQFTSPDIFFGVLAFHSANLFFIAISITFLIGTCCLLASCLMSPTSAAAISRTEYEIIYHSVAFLLYLAASLTLLIECTRGKYINSFISVEMDVAPYIAASVMGLLTSVSYLLSTYFALKIYRGN